MFSRYVGFINKLSIISPHGFYRTIRTYPIPCILRKLATSPRINEELNP
jgi:hypothetical protein